MPVPPLFTHQRAGNVFYSFIQGRKPSEYRVHGFDNTEAAFYAAMWALASLSSLARSLRDGDFLSVRDLAGSVACGGFLAVACAGLLVASPLAEWASGGGVCVFTSVACGLVGKNGDTYLRKGLDLIMSKIFGKDAK